MDRGRCGLDLESNRFLREQKLTRKRNDHLHRLKKIKTRKPGSSSTLDNTPPECMFCDRFKSDPRKVSKKKELNNSIERENKVLLQRISHILTAPPKITDASYIAMKKLLSTLSDTNSFNQDLKKKYNKQFFDRVNKTTPYYDHKKWEQEYEEQLRGQKFMRQVNYKRPSDWVDPFQGKPPPEDYDQKRSRLRRERETARSAGNSPSDEPDAFARSTGDLAGVEQGKGKGGHVNKVKKLRASKSNPNPKKKDSFGKEKEVRVSSITDAANETDEAPPPPFNSRVLAQAEREITMHTPGSIRVLQALSLGESGSNSVKTPAERRKGSNESLDTEEKATLVPACVICSLVENAYLYITIDGVETQLHAEALVHVSALFLSESESAEGKTQMNFPLDDEGAQELLALDIVEGVSLLKNPKDFQVMLPWSSPEIGSAGGSGSNSNVNTHRGSTSASIAQMDMTSVMNALDEHEHEPELEDGPRDELAGTLGSSEREQDDLDEYFTPISVSCGIKAVVSCGVEPDDVNSRMKMRKKKEALGIQDFVPEDVYMLVKVSRVGEERARVVVHTLRDSVNQYKKGPAVPANTRLELLIALPSVLTVESNLMEDYFRNAASNIRVEHDQESGDNVLIFD